MAHTISLSDDSHVLTATFTGVVDYDEIEMAGLERLAFPDSERVKIWVTDFTDAAIGNVTKEDVERDVRLAERVAQFNPNLVIVAIMPDQFAYGMGRMWQGLAGTTPPLETQVVRTRAEALESVTALLAA